MKRILGMMLVVAGLSCTALAGDHGFAIAPEIDGITAISALTLVGGAILVIRSRRR